MLGRPRLTALENKCLKKLKHLEKYELYTGWTKTVFGEWEMNYGKRRSLCSRDEGQGYKDVEGGVLRNAVGAKDIKK